MRIFQQHACSKIDYFLPGKLKKLKEIKFPECVRKLTEAMDLKKRESTIHLILKL